MSCRRPTTSIAAASNNNSNNQHGIPLSVWIQRAKEYSISKQQNQGGGGVDYYYVELAVTVALELTNHLCEVVEEIRNYNNVAATTTAAAVPPSSPLRLDNDNGDDLLSGHYDDFPLSFDIDDGGDIGIGDDNLCSKEVEAALLPLLQVEHITPENVIISIGVPGATTMTMALAATGAHIQVGLTHLTDDYDIEVDNHYHPLMQQNICYALGKILLREEN
jgi:hypothetical protein